MESQEDPNCLQICKISKTVEDAVYVARCFHEIYPGERGEKQIDVEVITDSQSLLDSIHSTKQIEDKMMRPIIKWFNQMMSRGIVQEFRWCDTNVCLADALTKPGSPLCQTLLDVCRSRNMIDLRATKKTGRKVEEQRE